MTSVHTTTRAAVRTLVRQRTDLVNSNQVSDSELNSWITQSLAWMHDLLVGVDSEYLVSKTTITLTGTESYSVPSDFYKAKLVEFSFGNGRYRKIERLKMDERDRYADPFTWYPQLPQAGNPAGYDIVAGLIYFFPEQATGPVRLWYYPSAPQPADDSETFDVLNGFDESIVADVALKIAEKLGGDTGVWERRKADAEQRVKAMGQERDVGGSWGMTLLPRGR